MRWAGRVASHKCSVWYGLNWLRVGSSCDYCKHGYDISAIIKGGEFFDHMNNIHLFQKDS